MMMKTLLVLSVLVALVAGDCYMHNPPGSVNRLNGNGNTVTNQNRMCDTQNNNNGGYCWGPSMSYYVGSMLSIEWTNQHSCGAESSHCELVIQAMCHEKLRDGTSTDTITGDNYEETNEEGEYVYGMHERYEYYQKCSTRQRNMGLFTADRQLNRNDARATRQNNNGAKRGFECPEERDHYPYWHPTEWKDIAILTTNTDRCEWYQAESQNVKGRNWCDQEPENNIRPNNEAACQGEWKYEEPWGIDAPFCGAAPWNRENHLGNGRNGRTNRFNWTIPDWPSSPDDDVMCVLRIRYNISTADAVEDGWSIDYASNGAKSPIKQDPWLYFGTNKHHQEAAPGEPEVSRFIMAINTNQFGRTFQDRSHSFKILARPKNVASSARIHNLNVRGKRGNIVQAYPAVEYDFCPQMLQVLHGDYIHFQWTGCDTNNAGTAGEGLAQTDRSNIVQIWGNHANKNYIANPNNGTKGLKNDKYFFGDLAHDLAWIGQTDCESYEVLQDPALNGQHGHDSNDRTHADDEKNCGVLNAAKTPKFNGGLWKVQATGRVSYMSTRNNNYTNRSQKGFIEANAIVETFGIVLLAAAGVVFAGAVTVAIVAAVAPASACGAAVV